MVADESNVNMENKGQKPENSPRDSREGVIARKLLWRDVTLLDLGIDPSDIVRHVHILIQASNCQVTNQSVDNWRFYRRVTTRSDSSRSLS